MSYAYVKHTHLVSAGGAKSEREAISPLPKWFHIHLQGGHTMRLNRPRIPTVAVLGLTVCVGILFAAETIILKAGDFERDGTWENVDWCWHGSESDHVWIVHRPANPNGGVTGEMWTTFNGPSGNYDMDIGIHMKMNGQSFWEVRVNGNKVAGGKSPWPDAKCEPAGDQCLPIKVADNVRINKGDEIRYIGTTTKHDCVSGGVYAGWYELKLYPREGTIPDSDGTPPSAPSNLLATADGKTTINLSWDEASDDESGISSYNIYRNGEKVGSTDNTNYTDDGLSEGTTYKYQVSAVNGEDTEGEKSNESSATTEAENDTLPPEPTSAIAQSATSVKVSFNELITKESAGNTGHYSVSGGITVSGASLQGDNKSVVLTTSTLTEKTSYTLTVSDITDRSPNANTGGGQVDFMLSGEIQISNLSVGSGKAYEIVEAIAEGDKQFVDRDFTWESLGDYAGMACIRTANDDDQATDESFLSFDINTGATIYVAYRHGSDLPPWLSSWSKTGNQVCGDGCSEVYEKDFGAGTVTLGGNKPGGAGNMYTVFVDAAEGAETDRLQPTRKAVISCSIGCSTIGGTIRISGLYPHQWYTVMVTDARGSLTSGRRDSGVGGMVSLSSRHPPLGVYMVSLRSAYHRHAFTVVVLQSK